MAVTLSGIEPASTHLSGNPILVKATTTGAPAGASHYKMLLKITSINNVLFGSPFVDGQEPNADNSTEFDISGYVDQPLPYTFSFPLYQFIIGYAYHIHVVHLKPGESYIDTAGNRQENWYDDLQPIIILSGKIDESELSLYSEQNTNWFEAWVETGKFLTRLPDHQSIHPNQPVKLWVKWPVQSNGVAVFTVKGYYSNGHFETITYEPILFGDHVFEINLHPGVVGLDYVIQDGHRLMRYTVQWSGGGITSPLMTYDIDWSPKLNCNFLLYVNPIGGIDCIWLNGACDPGFNASMIEAKKPQPKEPKRRDHTVEVSKNTRMEWKINTGYKSREEMEALIDLFRSEKVWLLHNAEILSEASLFPVIVKNSDNILTNWDSDIHDLDLDLIIAH